jgi:hypothetical protein
MSAKAPKTGEIVAVMVSVWLGLASLIGSHLWSVANVVQSNLVLLKIGSWMPGWWGIGPYAGKETIGLVTWLVSWVILFYVLKERELKLKPWIYGFVIGFIALIVLIWPAVYHAILGWSSY